jgi:alkanesulfonate monooxygenase SsuD/methylene tetrahydromethanopterin reductase-like flavin-dependent oxidoreductase (luciferase family)
MNAYWAAITRNLRVGQLGYVMSTQNPIRVAEEAAVRSSLTGPLFCRRRRRLPVALDERA